MCVGAYAVPTVTIGGKALAVVTKHKRDAASMLWLLKALGVGSLPDLAVLTRLHDALQVTRGPKSKFCRKMSVDGNLG